MCEGVRRLYTGFVILRPKACVVEVKVLCCVREKRRETCTLSVFLLAKRSYRIGLD